MNRFALTYIISSTLVSVVKSNSIQLLSRLVKAVENSSATLTCSKENGSINETIWTNSQIAEDANLTFNNGKCIVTGFLLNSDLFDGKCNGNRTYSVMLKKINRTQHGTEWTCSETVTMKSNIVSIYVTVPAKGVDIRLLDEKLYMTENQTQTVRCQTSPCRPSPTVKWYLRHYNGKITYDITENSTQSYILQEHGLMAAESILKFFPNRTFNNWHLFCEAWTQVDNADISSQVIKVNVSFPPSRVDFIIFNRPPEAGAFIANNGEDVPFFCMAVSNPKSEIIIRDRRDRLLTTLKDAKIVDYTKYNVSCDDAGEYTCHARNMLTIGQEAKSKHSLVVRCQPRPRTVKDNNVTVLLGSDVTLQFTAHDFFDEQNKTDFTWYKQNMPLKNDASKYIISSYGLLSVLVIRNITQTDYGQYRVIVRNSVGQYIYYYELHEKDIEGQQEPVESAISGIITGVAVGTFAFTILVVVMALLGYKYIRRNQSLGKRQATGNKTVSENQTTSTYNDINMFSGPKTVYEQLGDKGRDGHAYMEMQDIKTNDTRRDYMNMSV